MCTVTSFLLKNPKSKNQLHMYIFVLTWRNVWKDIYQVINIDYLRAMATISRQFDSLQWTIIFKIYIVRWGGFWEEINIKTKIEKKSLTCFKWILVPRPWITILLWKGLVVLPYNCQPICPLMHSPWRPRAGAKLGGQGGIEYLGDRTDPLSWVLFLPHLHTSHHTSGWLVIDG